MYRALPCRVQVAVRGFLNPVTAANGDVNPEYCLDLDVGKPWPLLLTESYRLDPV